MPPPDQHKSSEPRRIVTPRGDFVFRLERPEDDPFLFQLFVASNIAILRLAGFPDDVIEKLIAFQYRSQTSTYRAMFPDACYSIVEFEGETIGRFIEHDEGEVVYFVDFVLLPESQSKGLGAALTGALMNEWAARGRGTRVKVQVNNEPCLKMCRRLGFFQTDDQSDGGYVELRWYPPHLMPKRKGKPG